MPGQNLPSNLPIRNNPDPNRVTKTDQRTDQSQSHVKEQTTRFDSNYQTFARRLGGSAELLGLFSRIFHMGKAGTLTSTAKAVSLEGDIEAEFEMLTEMLKMDKEEFLKFLKNQLQTGSRFSGALFTLLRNAYDKSDSEGFRRDVLQFMKKYSDHSSTAHIEKNLVKHLNQIAKSIPARFGQEVLNLLAQLEEGIAQGDRTGNLKLLQGQIIPFMSRYIARTHDMGTARDLLSQLTLEVARYESGSREALVEAFFAVKHYPALKNSLGNLDEDALMVLLRNSNFAKAAQSNQFAEQLASLSQKALQGAGGVEMQEAFRDLIATILVNESVYMPLNHHLIPLEHQGKLLFSELWVDPNDEQDTPARSEIEQSKRIFFKLDVGHLGQFDLVLFYREKMLDVQLRCPSQLAQFAPVFQGAIRGIVQQNGLVANSVQIQQSDRPWHLSEVFPKLLQRKDSINVKV